MLYSIVVAPAVIYSRSSHMSRSSGHNTETDLQVNLGQWVGDCGARQSRIDYAQLNSHSRDLL